MFVFPLHKVKCLSFCVIFCFPCTGWGGLSFCLIVHLPFAQDGKRVCLSDCLPLHLCLIVHLPSAQDGGDVCLSVCLIVCPPPAQGGVFVFLYDYPSSLCTRWDVCMCLSVRVSVSPCVRWGCVSFCMIVHLPSAQDGMCVCVLVCPIVCLHLHRVGVSVFLYDCPFSLFTRWDACVCLIVSPSTRWGVCLFV